MPVSRSSETGFRVLDFHSWFPASGFYTGMSQEMLMQVGSLPSMGRTWTELLLGPAAVGIWGNEPGCESFFFSQCMQEGKKYIAWFFSTRSSNVCNNLTWEIILATGEHLFFQDLNWMRSSIQLNATDNFIFIWILIFLKHLQSTGYSLNCKGTINIIQC